MPAAYSTSIAVYLVFLCVLVAAGALGLANALTPTHYANPGLSAYTAPPGTALLPPRLPDAVPRAMAAVDAALSTDASASQPPSTSARTAASQVQKPRKARRTAAREPNNRSPFVNYARGYEQPWF